MGMQKNPGATTTGTQARLDARPGGRTGIYPRRAEFGYGQTQGVKQRGRMFSGMRVITARSGRKRRGSTIERPGIAALGESRPPTGSGE